MTYRGHILEIYETSIVATTYRRVCDVWMSEKTVWIFYSWSQSSRSLMGHQRDFPCSGDLDESVRSVCSFGSI
jgi:hypothetical protein